SGRRGARPDPRPDRARDRRPHAAGGRGRNRSATRPGHARPQDGARPGGVEVKIETSFDVPVPPERAWALLMDVPRVIPCMPGATLTETVDDANWKAAVKVKLGPISLAFDTTVKREEADES